MLLALGAASAALDALTSLVSPKPSPGTGFTQINDTPFDVASSASSSAATPGPGTSSQPGSLSPSTMHALLTLQSQSSNVPVATPGQSDALKYLLSQTDAESDGPAGLDLMSSETGSHRPHRRANAASASAASAYDAIGQAKQSEAQTLSASLGSSLSLSA